MFLGTFGLGPNLVRTPGMPKTNVFGHIRAWAQFGPNSRNAENECFWAHSGLGPIWSELPECRKRMLLGTFGLGPNLVRTLGIPKTNAFGHTRAWAQFRPNCWKAQNKFFWAPWGLGPIWSELPECRKRMFLGTFGLGPNLVRTPGMPKTNVFGHVRAWAQIRPNSRNAEKECFWAHSGLGPIWSELPECQKRMLLGTFGLGPNLVRTPGIPKTNAFGHIRAWAQFGPNSRNAKNECFWAHSGLGPIWSEVPECPKVMLLGTFGLGPNLVRTPGMPETNVFGHVQAWAQFGLNCRKAQNECFWAHSGLGPNWSELPEGRKRMFLGTLWRVPKLVRTPGMPKRNVFGHIRVGPNLVRTPGMPKTNAFRHVRAWAQLGANSRNSQNECFWAHSGLGPIWSELPESPKRMFLGTFRLGPNLVRTPGRPKTNVFGHTLACAQIGPNSRNAEKECFWAHSGWAQFGPNSRNAENECFWARSGLGPTWCELAEFPKRMLLGTFGLGPNLVRTPGRPKTNVFGHSRAWAQFGPNSTKAQNECFWAHSGLGPTWSELPEFPKRMLLGTFGLGPNLVRTLGMPKTNVFGHIRAWAQFGPNSRNAEAESFWAHSGLGPIWSELPECRKRMLLGTFGLGPNLVRTPGMPKTNVFGHIRAWAQFGPNCRKAQNECFWAHSSLGPIWSELPESPKRMFLGTFGLGPNLVRTPGMPKTNVFGHIRAWAQFGPNSRNAENESFWAHSGLGPIWSELPESPKRMLLGTFGLGPNLVRTLGIPKTNAFGHTRAWAQFGPNSRNAKNECFWAHSGLGPISSELLESPKQIFLGTLGLGPNLVRTPGMPKTNVFGHIRAWAQFGPNSRNAKNECFWARSGLGPNSSQLQECRKGMFLGTFRLGPNLVRTPGMPKTNAFGHIRAWAQLGPNSRNSQNECFWAHSGLGPIWSEVPECPKVMLLGTFGLGPNLVRTPGMPETNVFGHVQAWAQFGLNCRKAQNECFWAHSGLGPNWSELPEGRKRMFLGTLWRVPKLVRTPGMPKRNVFGHIRVGPNLVRTPGMPKTNAFRHVRAWAQLGANSRNSQNECFWAHSGLGPIWSELPESPKRMFLGTFRLGPNLVRTPGRPKTNVFGHTLACAQIGPNSRNAEKECFWAHSGWAQFGPNSRNAENECFWERSGLGPTWCELAEFPKRMLLGTFGLGPNLVRTPGRPKTNVFGHSRAWAQFGPNSRKAQNECFWAHSGLGPTWSELPEFPKRMLLGTFGLGPNLVRTLGMPKTNVFGHIRAWAQFGPNSRNAEAESFWAHSGLGPIWSELPECRKRMLLGTFGLGPNLVRTPGMPKTNVFGHIRAWAQFGPNCRKAQNECFWAHSSLGPIWSELPESPKRMFLGTFGLGPNLVRTPGMPKTNVFGHIRAWAQFGPNSRNAENESFWAHSGLGPIWSELPECRKRMLLGTFGLGPNLVRTLGIPKTNAFGHTRAWAQFGPNSRNAKNECFWAHSGLGPISSELLESPKQIFLGTLGLGPNLVRTPGMPKTNVFGHIRAWAQFGPNSRNAKNECFWARSGLGPNSSQLQECRKGMFLGTFRLGPNLVRTPGMPKTNAFGHIRAWAQLGPNSRNSQNECFWAHSGLGPIWSEVPECPKVMLLGTFGLGPNLVRTPGMPETNVFGHVQAWAQFGPNCRKAQNECFWAHSGLGPNWSELPESPKRMLLGTFGLGPKLVRTPGKPKTNVFGHIQAWAQFGPNSRNAENECFWAHSGLGPIWSELPECRKRMLLGTFGLGPNLVRTLGIPKTNAFGHIRAWAQFGPNSRKAQNECFWAHSGLGPIWSELPEGRKRMFLGTFWRVPKFVRTPGMPKRNVFGHIRVGPNLVRTPGMPKTNAFGHVRAWAQLGANSRNSQNECFWAHSGLGPISSELLESPKQIFLGTLGLGPNLVRTPGMPKTNVFGHIRAWAQFGPNSRNTKNECFWARSGLGPNSSELQECRQGMFLGTFRLGPNLVRTPGMPKTNAFGHIRAWAQLGPNSRNSQNECFWARSGLGPIWSELPECQKRMFLGTFGLGPNLVRSPGMPKSNAFGHIRAWAQLGPNSRNARNECFWARSGLGPIWSELPESPKRMLLGTFGLGPKLVRTPGKPKTNVFGHIQAWAQFGPNSRKAENECFWAHSGVCPNWSELQECRKGMFLGTFGLGPIWSELPECRKRMLFGTFGLGPNLVRTRGIPKTNAFGHIRAWAQFGPNSRKAQNECFWAHSGLGPIWSELPEGRKRMFLGTFWRVPKFVRTPGMPKRNVFGHIRVGPNLVRTPGMPKTNAFGHVRAWAQLGANSRNSQNECFWAHSGLGPIWSELPESPKRMLLGTFGLGPNLVRTPGIPKTYAFGHIRAWAQFGPNSRNAQNECFWAHSGLGPIWSELQECRSRKFLGTFGLGPNLVRTPGMPKTNAFGHIRAWAQLGPNSRNAENECFWAHSGLGPIWSELPESPKRMLLGTFGLGPNLVRTLGIPKTNAFGHIRAWAQFGPNSRKAQNECFWAHSGLGPIWSELPEGRKRMFLGTFWRVPKFVRTPGMPKRNVFGHIRVGPNLVRTPGMPKTNAFGHVRAWAQLGANSRNSQNECFWAHSGLGPISSELLESPKQIFLGTLGLGPNLVRTPGMPKTNVFGHIRAWAQFGPNSRNTKNECFWARSGLGPNSSELQECRQGMFLGTFRLGPNLVRTPGMPKTNAFGHIRAWAQLGPNSRNSQNECFWAHSGLGPIWSELPECQKRMFLGTFGLGPNLVRSPGMPKSNAFGHIRAWAQLGPNSRNARNECFWARSGLGPIWSELPESPKRMLLGTFGLGPKLVRTPGKPKTNVFGHIQAWAQFGPNSRKAENECFWAHSGVCPNWSELQECRKGMFLGTFGLGPIWSELPECRKRMLFGTFGLGPNLVRTRGIPKTNAFGHIRAWAQFGPNSRKAQNECFWAHSGLGPIWSELPEGRKRMFLGTFWRVPKFVRTPGMPKRNVFGHIRVGPNLVRTPGMPKTNAFGHVRAWAQLGANSRNSQNECFWAHSGLGPIWSELPESPKRMLLGTFGLGPNLVRTPGIPKTYAFGHIRAWAQFGPNSRNAQNECFWAHSGLGPIWSELQECRSRKFLGTFGLGPNLVRTPGMPKTNAFGHIRAWAQLGPNSRNAENECFWAHSGLGPIWSELPESPKRMLLGTFELGPNLVRTPGKPKTNVFGHIRAWAQFGPNSRNAENECFWAHSGLGPIWSKLQECRKRKFLGTFGLGPNLVRTPGMPKTNAFGHIRAWAQLGPNSRDSQNECFWAHSGLGPIWSELPECQKRMFLGTFGPGPNFVRTAGKPKTNFFGHLGAWAQSGPNSRNAENECFWAHSGLGPIWSELPECQKRMFLGTFGLGPKFVPTPGMPKRNVFGHIPAWAQFGPNSRNAENECFWAHSGLGPTWSELPEFPKRMLLGTFGLGPNLVRSPGMPKSNAFGHIRAWAQLGPNSRNARNECFWARSGLGPIWSELPESPKRMLLGTFGLGPKLVRTPGKPKTNVFGHIHAWAQFGPNSRKAENECFWAHSGVCPNWSELQECRKGMLLGTFGLGPIWCELAEFPKRMLLGTFGLGPNLVRTPGKPNTNVFGHIQAWAQFGPNSRKAENECFWAHSGVCPNWSELPECRKGMFLGTFGLGPNLVRTRGIPKTNAFGHIRAWAEFGPNSRKAENECFWSRSGLGPIWSELPEGRKRMFLGTFWRVPKFVRTPGMPKRNFFGHIRAWAQFGANSRNSQNECFWAHSGLGPIWSELPESPTRMFLGTFRLGPNLVRTPGRPKTNVFGHTLACAQIGPNSRNAENECFWARSGLGPTWCELAEFPKRMLLGTFGLGPNLVRTPGMPKTNVFGHSRAWAQFGPNSRKARNESFWAHPGLGLIWSELPECQKRMLLGTFGLGPNLVQTPGKPKTNAFGHLRAWAQFGPNSRNAQNECFRAHSGLGPISSELLECPKRMLLGSFGLGPNLVRTAGKPKTNAFGHIRAWAQFGPNSRNSQNECFWAHWGLGPIWSELLEFPKRMLLGTFGLGPNSVRTLGMPKTNAFGHIRAWAQFCPNSRNSQNEYFWAHSDLGPIWSELPECPK